MDPGIWKESKRGFPFNISLKKIVLFSLFLPLSFQLISTQIRDTNQFKISLTTVIISVASFFLSDAVIKQFKGSLEAKGLFGKDLNKAGKREDKPTV
jgi:hypothetical protein